MKFKAGDKVKWFRQSFPKGITKGVFIDEINKRVRITVVDPDGSSRTVMTLKELIEHDTPTNEDMTPAVALNHAGFKA